MGGLGPRGISPFGIIPRGRPAGWKGGGMWYRVGDIEGGGRDFEMSTEGWSAAESRRLAQAVIHGCGCKLSPGLCFGWVFLVAGAAPLVFACVSELCSDKDSWAGRSVALGPGTTVVGLVTAAVARFASFVGEVIGSMVPTIMMSERV